ncbi:hypothetical protein Tco_1160225 [Tanacetum coccineum]
MAFVEPFNLEEPIENPAPPVVLMADNRTMAQLLQAPTEGYEDAIVIPEINANFELKHSLINLVQNKQFFGHDKEDPHAHIQQQQTPPAVVEPLNLEEPIENPAPPVVTMDDNRTMAQLLEAPIEGYEDAIVVPEITADNFELKHGLLTLVQNKITSTMKFPNVPSTSDRFNDLLRACPHHGFSELHQLDTFYNALNSNDQDSLNSAAGDMVKALLLDKKSQAPTLVKAVEESCVTCGGAHSYRNCPATNGNVYRDNIQEYVSQAATANYNPGNTSVTKTDFESYVKANDAVMRNMQDQNQNLQNQMTNLTDMLSKFVNANTASSSGTGSLPSNTVTNPKEDLKGITTRSGVAYQEPTILTTSSSPKVVECETDVTKDTVLPTNNGSTKDVQPPVVQDQPHVPNSEPVVALVPNLKPTIPYPSRPLIGNKEKLSEMARTPLNEHCSVVILNKLPEKLGDPDKFLIPCDFPGMDE